MARVKSVITRARLQPAYEAATMKQAGPTEAKILIFNEFFLKFQLKIFAVFFVLTTLIFQNNFSTYQ